MAILLNKLWWNRLNHGRDTPMTINDNWLVEAKNGAVIRKHMGYGHIASSHAEAIEKFYEQHFNSYLNFHRPCGVPETVTNAKGKQRRVYRWYATPWDSTATAGGVAGHLQAGTTQSDLEQMAAAETTAATISILKTESTKEAGGRSFAPPPGSSFD